eukprot:2437249-Pyramimonas_sp.AAC.1
MRDNKGAGSGARREGHGAGEDGGGAGGPQAAAPAAAGGVPRLPRDRLQVCDWIIPTNPSNTYNIKRLLLRFTGPPVPITARMHSTPQPI